MKQGSDRLIHHQKDFFKRAIDIEEHQISLFEAPTGFGKSVITTTVAEHLALSNKKIIIASPTNQLSLELLDVFKNDSRFSFDKKLKIDMVVGVSNYFSVNNITNGVYDYIDKEQMESYIQNISSNEDYLIEKLFNSIDIEEPNKKIVKEMIAAKETNSEMYGFEDLDISVTNYAYLLTNVFFVKGFDASEFIIIGDEVHQLMSVAENLLTNSFSVFRMKSLTASIEKLLKNEKAGSKKLFTLLAKQKNQLEETLQKYSIAQKAGDSYTLPPYEKDGISGSIRKALLSTEENDQTSLSKSLDTLISNAVKKVNSTELNAFHKLYQSEKREMTGVLYSPEAVTVYLSPSKGYPTLNSAKGDVRGWMLSYFWDRIYAFIGVSATIKTSDNDTGAFSRLGLTRGNHESWLDNVKSINLFINKYHRFPNKDDVEEIRLVEFIERQRKGYEDGWLTEKKERELIEYFTIDFFNGIPRGVKTGKEEDEKITHIKYGVIQYEPIFKKEQATIFLPSEDLIEPQPQGSEEEHIWFDMIASVVAQKHENKNCMLICGGFYEVEQIEKRLSTLLPKIKIHHALRNTPASQVVSRFAKEGGIMIGTRNYGVGLNLPKEQLEKVFIAKIPFPIFTTKKWLDIKEKDRKAGTSFYHSTYIGEMVNTFRQWIGRLIRTSEDRGELYILDSRYNSKKYKSRLHYWLNKMGVFSEELIEYKHGNSEMSVKKEVSVQTFIASMVCEEDIKEYLLKNTDYIREHKLLPVPLGNDYDKDFKMRYRIIRKNYQDACSSLF